MFLRHIARIAAHWIINLYRAAGKLLSDAFQYNRNSSVPDYPPPAPPPPGAPSRPQ
jgi:hypothetical protein